MNIVFELGTDSLQRIQVLKEIFPEAVTKEVHSLSGDELFQIIIPATSTVLTAIAGSSVIIEWIKSKIIKVKIGGIEYEGRPENLPEEVRKAIQEESKHGSRKTRR